MREVGNIYGDDEGSSLIFPQLRLSSRKYKLYLYLHSFKSNNIDSISLCLLVKWAINSSQAKQLRVKAAATVTDDLVIDRELQHTSKQAATYTHTDTTTSYSLLSTRPPGAQFGPHSRLHSCPA
jgi:hypothetical protein